MLKAIRHGFTHLARFDGRDARQAFWFWVLFLYIVTTVVTMAVTMPMTMGMMATGFQQGLAQADNPDRVAAEAATRAGMGLAVARYIPAIMWTTLITGVVFLVAPAAAFVRRLHDSGLSGLWALLPGGLQAANLAALPAQIGRMRETMLASMSGNPMAGMGAIKSSFGIGAIAGWSAILIVIALGARKSTPGPNRYGDVPFVA
jgi:uncharacterized membrane protein YhaH (DUF805 family)